MSMMSRYKILKIKHPEYMILFLNKDDNFVSCDIDLYILLSLNKKRSLKNQLKKKHISYMIVDNLNILEKFDSKPNEYHKYYYAACLDILFDAIKSKCF